MPLYNPVEVTQAEFDAEAAADPTHAAGTLAARPDADEVNAGSTYFATDDGGGTLYRSNATAWTQIAASVTAAGGAELGYAEITSSFTTTTINADVDVTGLSVEVTVGTRPIFVEAFIPVVSHSTTTATLIGLKLFEDATQLQSVNGLTPTTASASGGSRRAPARLAPTAGAHTYKAAARQNVTGTLTFFAGATQPAYIRVTEG